MFAIVSTYDGLILLSMAFGFKGHIFIVLNPDLMFGFVNDCFKAQSTHLARIVLSGSMLLFLDIIASLTFLNVVLKGLKQYTCNGCNSYGVFDGNVIMSNLNSFAYSIASRVTWLSCPSITNKCWLLRDIPPRFDLLKKDKSSLNKKVVIHVFFCITIQVLGL